VPVSDFPASVLGRFAACLVAGLFAVTALAADAGTLEAKYAALRGALGNNQFLKPLYLESAESANGVAGDIYALIDHPFAATAAALVNPNDWCEILILPINTKYCRATTVASASVLNVRIGRKVDQPLDQAYRVDFTYRVAVRNPDFLRVRLSASEGPLSTRDYLIVLEAVPVEEGRTFIHLSYSYSFDAVGRLAMRMYLGTAGKGKVGFTVTGTQADGRPAQIEGTRGVVERNTMRYFLAIEAFLGALAVAPEARLEKRLGDWFAAAERYPRQLHDMERGEYLDMKRREYRRQQAGSEPLSMTYREVPHVQDASAGRQERSPLLARR
jgi:hypothetical protein